MIGSFTIGNPKEGGIYTGDEREIVKLVVYNEVKFARGIDAISWMCVMHTRRKNRQGTYYLSKEEFEAICRTTEIGKRALAQMTAYRMLDSVPKEFEVT